MPIELTLFGSPEVRLHGQPVTGFRTSKSQALLYYLAITGRPHTRATLAGLLWGDQPEDAARVSLSKCLSNLRDLLGDAMLIERQTVAFNRDYPYDLDTERFAVAVGQPPTVESSQALQAALTLYRGDLLEGFYVREAPDFEQWLLLQRAHYREAVITGLHALAGFYEQQGDLPSAITHTRRLLTLEPWREEAHRQLMTLLAHSGQRAAALAQFETCRQILDEELAVAPDAETVALVEAIRADKITRWRDDKITVAPPQPVTPSPAYPLINNLPIPATPLIGREHELAELGALLDEPYCRLLTITGPGGIGKTRLALALAERYLSTQRMCDSFCFVPLAAVDTVQALLPTLLAALPLPLESRQALAEAQKRQVLDFLANKQLLLIFDNFEQLTEGGPLLVELLAAAPALRLLVTSRERLHLRAEQLYPLSGLTCPATASDVQAPAFTLLLHIARRTQPHFRPDAAEQQDLMRICQLTDGMPLALELAAGWLHLLPTAAIVEALQASLDLLATTMADVPARHRSVRAAFATTWQLLNEGEHQRLTHLSIFRGGFTRQAAQQVANASLTHLNLFADKSLLEYRRTPDRYEIHELLRQYSLEQLTARGELADTQQRHAHYFLALAERAEAELRGPHQKRWLDELDGERDNFRTALAAMLTQAPTTALQLATALGPFWRRRDNTEGWQWLPAALAAAPAISPLRARALMFAGSLARRNGARDQARTWLTESVAFWRTQDDPNNLAQALRHLGWGYYSSDTAQALLCFEESLALFRQLGDQQRIAQNLTDLAHLISEVKGDYDQATDYARESLALMRTVGDQTGIANALLLLANLMDLQGQYRATAPMYQEALELYRLLGNQSAMSSSLTALAENCWFRQEYVQARDYGEQAVALLQNLGGDPMTLLLTWHHLGLAELGLGNMARAQTCLQESLRLAQKRGHEKMMARGLAGLGGVAVMQQQGESAIQRLSAAYHQFDLEGPFLTPADQQVYQNWIATARAQVDEQRFAAAWAQGQTLELVAAVNAALG